MVICFYIITNHGGTALQYSISLIKVQLNLFVWVMVWIGDIDGNVAVLCVLQTVNYYHLTFYLMD